MCYCPCGSQPLTYGTSAPPAVFPANLDSFAVEQVRNIHTYTAWEDKGVTFNKGVCSAHKQKQLRKACRYRHLQVSIPYPKSKLRVYIFLCMQPY